MKLVIRKTERIIGEAEIPASKSHTIRAIVIASLAKGTTLLHNVLESEDTEAAINACLALGAKIKRLDTSGNYEITGFDGRPKVIHDKINTLNSGTTTNIISSVAALIDKKILIDGDESIQKRPVQPLLDALNNLGATAVSLNKNCCPPIEVIGRLKGGKTEIDCKSSQYVTSLLITAPLLADDTEITIKNICEKPYIEMTLKWLDDMSINYKSSLPDSIKVFGRQRYNAFEKTIPADWSSATFLLVAGVLLGENLIIKGLDIDDTQPDKEVISYLKKMGADINVERDKITLNRSVLQGCELDLNNTPDALPAVAVLACYADGITVIKNVAHARLKETDRIKVMATELKKMGAKIMETQDGMMIEHSELRGARLDGHMDHRVVMALSLAGIIAKGKTTISTAESVNVTFPSYIELMKKLGANILREDD